MSQLVTRPGRNAAREAKRIKEVQKVKHAIQWHEKARKKRQEIARDRWEAKQAVLQHIKWENDNVRRVRRRALGNVIEDWKLGPLRPNRAIGTDPEKYGALTAQQVQRPSIPLKTQENRNKQRESQGLPLEYPLVVDEKKYFPIVEGDRVLVLKGRDRGKIGIVSDVLHQTHHFIVRGLNEQSYDRDVFSSVDPSVAVVNREVPIALEDLRLIAPYETFQQGFGVYRDVIVEKIFMERHTTGIDPFTGRDYGDATIPEDHQFDPSTGLPIFHRYVAGTNQRIAWPWETEKKKAVEAANNQPAPKKKGILKTLTSPIASLKNVMTKSKSQTPKPKKKHLSRPEQIEKVRQREEQRLRAVAPRSEEVKPESVYMDDTTRNSVESAESMQYRLIGPPMPETLDEELRGHTMSSETRKTTLGQAEEPRANKTKKVSIGGSPILNAVAEQRKLAAQSMKTPMQLHWEIEHAKKLRKQKQQPLVQTGALLAALGKHMAKPKSTRDTAGYLI